MPGAVNHHSPDRLSDADPGPAAVSPDRALFALGPLDITPPRLVCILLIFLSSLTSDLLQVIDEDRDGSESGGESCTPAVQSCPGVSLLSGVEGPGDHPLQPADVCDLTNSLLD